MLKTPEKLFLLQVNDLENGDVGFLCQDNAEVDRIKYQIHERNVDIIVSPKKGKFNPEDVIFKKNSGDFDLIITVGANSLEDLGGVFSGNPEVFTSLPIVNISNSIDNEFFGKVNLVEVARSANETLFDMFMDDPQFRKN